MNVFLSSTCYDLADVRGVLELYFTRRGDTIVLSDRTSFPVDPSAHRHDLCVQRAGEADLLVLVIDQRLGAPYVRDKSISITHAEFREAAAKSVPVLAFVRRGIWTERHVFKLSLTSDKGASETDARRFALLDEVQDHSRGTWMHEFDDVTNILEAMDAMTTPDQSPPDLESRMDDVVHNYYGSGNHSNDELRPYEVTTHMGTNVTRFYSQPSWVGLRARMDQIECKLVPQDMSPPANPDPAYARMVRAKLELKGVRLWSDPSYRLVSLSKDNGTLRFGFDSVDFLEYRFSAGLMADELRNALMTTDAETVLANRSTLLPLRELWMESRQALTALDRRLCAGGAAVMVALARGAPDHDFLIPVHVRSGQVAEGQGYVSASFNGFHEWHVDSAAEVHIRWTVFRELFEELFGGEEAERPSRHLMHDWYFKHPYMNYFRDASRFTTEVLGIGFDSLTGNWECAVLLALTNEDYWNDFANLLQYNWEASKQPKDVLRLSTKNIEPWKPLLGRRWASDSLVCLAEGMKRLHEIDPSRFGFDVASLITGRLVEADCVWTT